MDGLEWLFYIADATTPQWLRGWDVELRPAGNADEEVFAVYHF